MAEYAFSPGLFALTQELSIVEPLALGTVSEQSQQQQQQSRFNSPSKLALGSTVSGTAPASSETKQDSAPQSHASSSQASSAAVTDSPSGNEPGYATPKLDRLKLRWSVGRAPWYDASGARARPFIIGVTGGSASGKTSVCKAVVEKLGIPWVVMISMDRFYRSLTPDEMANVKNYNFDHPNAFDIDQMVSTLAELKTGKVVHVPNYDFVTHSRTPHRDTVYGVDVVIVEGILVLYDERVRDLLDLKIYVDTDSDLRLIRRIKRDIRERGRTVESVIQQYLSTVKPSFEAYIMPTKRYADLIIPWNSTNHVAVDLLAQHIAAKLEARSREHLLSNRGKPLNCPPELLLPNQMPSAITVMEQTRALRCIHTIIRDQNTDAETFKFNLNRLVRLLVTEAMNRVDYTPKEVTTPTGSAFQGLEYSSNVIAVSIVRTGEVFELALRNVLPEVSIGKVVIQQYAAHKQEYGPRLYYAKLPSNIAQPNTKVLLFDGVLATGGAVLMAVQVLLDHGVNEEDIIFCCFVAAPEGLFRVHTIFPKLKIVTSWIDDGLDSQHYVRPGMGYLGDRYFGTGVDKIEIDEQSRKSFNLPNESK